MIGKTVNSLLIIVFLFGSMGYSVSMHYCGNTRISTSVGMEAKSCCGDENGTCCHNETRHYQIKDRFFASTREINEQNKLISHFILIVVNETLLYMSDIASTEINYIAESPPPISLRKHLSSIQTYLL